MPQICNELKVCIQIASIQIPLLLGKRGKKKNLRKKKGKMLCFLILLSGAMPLCGNNCITSGHC